MQLQINSRIPVARATANPAASGASTTASAPQNGGANLSDIMESGPSDVPERLAKLALMASVPAAAGVFAGLARGPLAGIAGAVAATPILVLGGTIAGCYITENLMGKSDGEQLGGVFIGGGLGLAAGAVGGYLLASSSANPALAVGLGVAGALSGALVGVLRS